MPNPQTRTTTTDDLVVSTIAERQKKAKDLTTECAALFRYLKKNARKTWTGGTELRHEVRYRNNPSKFYSEYEKFETTQQQILTYFVFDPKMVMSHMSYSGLDEAINSGPQQYIDLIDERYQSMEDSHFLLLKGSTAGVYSNGTGFGGKGIGGIQQIISGVPSSGIVGGIDRGTNSWARNQVYRAITDGGAAISSANIKRYLNRLWLKCKVEDGGAMPGLVISDDNNFLAYEESLQAIQQIGNAERADAGYAELAYKGKPFVADGGFGGGCPANTSYMINTDSLYFRPHSKKFMAPLKAREAFDQDATVRYMVSYCNLTFDDPRRFGVLTNT